MSEYLFSRQIMTGMRFFIYFSLPAYTGPGYLSYFIYVMPIQNHTLTSSSTCNFWFKIIKQTNSLKNLIIMAREIRLRHAALNG